MARAVIPSASRVSTASSRRAQRLSFRAPVLHAADLLVFPVLLRDRGAMVELVTSVLGAADGSAGRRTTPAGHAVVVLHRTGAISATARLLDVSARAVQYRLDRIRWLTGYSPTEQTQRFTLEAAVLGARVLGWPDEPLT